MIGTSVVRRSATAVAILVAALGACTGNDTEAPRAAERGEALSSPATDVGPFAGMRWPGGPLPVGSLLHDDAETLWSVDPASGERVPIWEHPRALVTGLSVGPGGAEVAISVDLDRSGRDEFSSVLYLLKSDGSVETVDAVRGYGQLYAPTFLRAPGNRDGPVRLYWLRSFDEMDRQRDAFHSDVVTRKASGGPIEEVTATLRHGESVGDIRGYPGGMSFTLALARVDSDPTTVEIVAESGGRKDSATVWSRFAHRANTEAALSVAWLSAYDYVVVQQAHDDDTGHLVFKHFVRTCVETSGYRLVYDGFDIDDARSDAVWNLLPLATNEVLVLTRDDVAQWLEDQSRPMTWTALSLRTGTLRPTPVAWERGPWTSVWPDVEGDPTEFSDCEAYREDPGRVRPI